ncbi:hypothetical protein TU81_11865 [Pseudomonas lini]|nr:hypothetical protein TU81_11865 [Pseudomonas lini]
MLVVRHQDDRAFLAQVLQGVGRYRDGRVVQAEYGNVSGQDEQVLLLWSADAQTPQGRCSDRPDVR